MRRSDSQLSQYQNYSDTELKENVERYRRDAEKVEMMTDLDRTSTGDFNQSSHLESPRFSQGEEK